MTKLQMLKMLKDKVCQCTKCPELVASRKQIVFDNIDYENSDLNSQLAKGGNHNADVVFIGEGPGKDEDDTGRPFVGAAGQFLDKIIKACGWQREDVYIMNIVRCRPPMNRVPTDEEAANCSPFLKLQLKVIQPKVIVCLGATACKHILGFDARMSSYRGEWHEYKDGPVDAKVRCTYHPSYVLHIPPEDKDRKKEAKDAIWADMLHVIEAVKV